jgi:hypothetical protein
MVPSTTMGMMLMMGEMPLIPTRLKDDRTAPLLLSEMPLLSSIPLEDDRAASLLLLVGCEIAFLSAFTKDDSTTPLLLASWAE